MLCIFAVFQYSGLQIWFTDVVERDIAVNFEELVKLTVILGLAAHFIVSRCITKEFREAVFKYYAV